MTRPRDSQRGRVAAAEQEGRPGWRPLDGHSLAAAALVVASDPWFQATRKATKKKPIITTQVRIMARPSCLPNVNGGTMTVNLSGGKRTIHDLYHAFAHTITPDDVPLHGAEFAKNYLGLLERFTGPASRNKMKQLFEAHRVKWRTWSPEAKARAKERAATNGTPFTKGKRETQEKALVAMMRDLAGLPPVEADK